MQVSHKYMPLEDSSGSKCARVQNFARLYMQGLYRVLNISEYGWITPEYASVCLNVPQYA